MEEPNLYLADQNVPYFYSFHYYHTLNGEEDDYNRELPAFNYTDDYGGFIPYTLCVSHIRPDRFAYVITLDTSRATNADERVTNYPITIVANVSESPWDSGMTIESAFRDLVNYQIGDLSTVYAGDINADDVWPQLAGTDTGATE